MSNKIFKSKSKDIIKEATDIVLNTEDDNAAIAFLKDTLEDDFPGMDLGRMDLHKAIEVLDTGKNKSKNMKVIEDLNKSLGKFINKAESKSKKVVKKKAKVKKKRK